MFRFFELLPAILSWGTIILMIVACFFVPVWVAFFIILFDIYWFLKTLYYTFHLYASFKQIKKNLKIDWLDKLKSKEYEAEKKNSKSINWENIHHLVVLPMMDEFYDVVRESFLSLTKTNYPLDKFIVVLATEERSKKTAQKISEQIKEEFGNSFAGFLITTHPDGLEGEIPGKGSNESWAAKEAIPLINELKIPYEDILVSVFDVDTQVPKDYFSRLTYAYLIAENPDQSSYQPIPFFTNNIYESPAIGRVLSFSCSFWQMIQQSRPERLITFSSHSIPLKALIDINFWDKDIVSEDSQIFWKLYLHFAGNWRVVSLHYPVYMDSNIAPTFWKTMKNLYKQQRRWAWGAETVPYTLSGFFIKQPNNSKIRGKEIPLKTRIAWTYSLVEGYYSWATNALIMFMLGWLPLLLGGDKFNATLLAYNLPQTTSFIMTVAMSGFITTIILGIIFLPPRPKWFKSYHYLLYALQWFLTPITIILFGSVPAIEAQTRLALGGKYRLGFWNTPKARAKAVSKI